MELSRSFFSCLGYTHSLFFLCSLHFLSWKDYNKRRQRLLNVWLIVRMREVLKRYFIGDSVLFFFVSCAESIIGDKWLWTAVNATVINSFRDFFHLNGENFQSAVNSELKSLTAWQQKLNLSLFRDIRNNRITSIRNGTFVGTTCSGGCSETSRNTVW